MKINGLPDNYLKITKESGCYIADYSSKEFDNESIIVPYSTNELSGVFKQSRQETEPIKEISSN